MRPVLARLDSLGVATREQSWNAATSIDWSVEVDFGGALRPDAPSVAGAFEASPLARYGRRTWDAFRWELQAWMVSQFLHGERGALDAVTRLVDVLPEADARGYARTQLADEQRHVEVFSRYQREHVARPYEVSPPLARLLANALDDRRWDFAALGMQIIVESLALAAFRMASGTFHDALIQQITALVARDEARHVSFGVLLLADVCSKMTASERAEREQFVLEAAELMSRRFLFAEIWERLGIDRAEGMALAARDPAMIAYRQALFGRVVSSLARIGLASATVRRGLDQLGLLGASGERLFERGFA